MTSRQPLVIQSFQGTSSQEIVSHSSQAWTNVQEENVRAQNETRSFSQADLGFPAQVG
jgi:hypothetical protein